MVYCFFYDTPLRDGMRSQTSGRSFAAENGARKAQQVLHEASREDPSLIGGTARLTAERAG